MTAEAFTSGFDTTAGVALVDHLDLATADEKAAKGCCMALVGGE